MKNHTELVRQAELINQCTSKKQKRQENKLQCSNQVAKSDYLEKHQKFGMNYLENHQSTRKSDPQYNAHFSIA